MEKNGHGPGERFGGGSEEGWAFRSLRAPTAQCVDHVTQWRECPGLCVLCLGMTAESPRMPIGCLGTPPLARAG